MKRLLSFFVFCAVAASATAVAPATTLNVNNQDAYYGKIPSDPEGAIRAAREQIAAGDLPGAIAGLQRYVNAHDREVGPRRFLGDLYFRAGQLDKAEFVYRVLLNENSNDKETHNRLGTVYAAENRIDDAIKQFTASLPGTDSVSDLVGLHQRKGDINAYRSEVEREAADARNSAEMQAELGQVYAALKMGGEAIKQFRLALDIDPTSLTALNGLGLAYLDVKAFELARGQFQSCLRGDPANFVCMNNLAATDLEAGHYDAAESELTRAHTIAPERAEALVNFGYLSDARGDWKGAIAYYARAIAVGPYTGEAYIDMSLAYEQHNLYPLAQAALLKGISAVPQDGRLHVLLARAYDAQGEHDRALAEYRIAAKSQDQDAARIAQTALSRSSPQ